jgi:hypothetical protein
MGEGFFSGTLFANLIIKPQVLTYAWVVPASCRWRQRLKPAAGEDSFAPTSGMIQVFCPGGPRPLWVGTPLREPGGPGREGPPPLAFLSGQKQADAEQELAVYNKYKGR